MISYKDLWHILPTMKKRVVCYLRVLSVRKALSKGLHVLSLIVGVYLQYKYATFTTYSWKV